MATLSVWRFGTPGGAGELALALDRAARAGLLPVEDAALVEWAVAGRKPRTRQLPRDVTSDPLDAGFWGLLFGLVFFVPLLGAAMGAATGALAGALADVGIDDHFINRVRDQVAPGTSALFVLTPDPVPQRLVDEALGRRSPEPIRTALDARQEAAVRAVFAD